MGRKIPGKKHRGVKDPEKQHLVRLKSLKGKINAPPTNPDFQEIPKSVNRIAELRANLKNKKQVKHKCKKPKQFEQFRGESDKHFLSRIQQACDTVIREKAFENKYGVDIQRNPNTGEVEKLVKRPKDAIDQMMKDAQKKKNKKHKKKTATDEPVFTKSQKRQKKITEKKQQKRLHQIEPEFHQDIIKFGEIAHEPPSLTVSKKIAKDEASRPGQRDLLLKSVIKGTMANCNHSQIRNSQQSLNKTINKAIDKSGKRKNLPVALRRRLEKQQAEVISAYRALKKQNQSCI